MTDMPDELLERVVDELRTLPPADEAAVRRIVRAAATDSTIAAPATVRGGRWWHSRVPLAAAAGLALAAGLGGFFAGEATSGSSAAPVASTGFPSPAESVTGLAQHVGFDANGVVPTQFVLKAPHASRVALVGDFNAWDATATPMTRDAATGIWTTTVRLPVGRHVYAYMVDGGSWTLDPRAATAQDPDFGTPSSVVLVGAP